MKDYKERIKSRVDILNFTLNDDSLNEYNKWINDAVNRGVNEHDALDYVYMRIKDNLSSEAMINNLQKFLKEAFCIDGDCKFIKTTKIDCENQYESIEMCVFKLTDSKRGEFYVSMGKKELEN